MKIYSFDIQRITKCSILCCKPVEKEFMVKKNTKYLEFASKEGSPFFLASFSVFNRLSIRENDNNPRPEVS